MDLRAKVTPAEQQEARDACALFGLKLEGFMLRLVRAFLRADPIEQAWMMSPITIEQLDRVAGRILDRAVVGEPQRFQELARHVREAMEAARSMGAGAPVAPDEKRKRTRRDTNEGA